MIYKFTWVAGMDDVFIGNLVGIWNLTFLCLTHVTRFWIGSYHESMEFQLLSGIKVSYENIFWPYFTYTLGVICFTSMTSITAKKLMEAYKDYKIRQRVKLRIIPEGKIVQYISCLKISVTSTCNFSTNIFFLNYSGD